MTKPCIAWGGIFFHDCEIINPVDPALIKKIDRWNVRCHCGNMFETTPHNLSKTCKWSTKSCKTCADKTRDIGTKKANKKNYYSNGFKNIYGMELIKPVDPTLNKIRDKWIVKCPICKNEVSRRACKIIYNEVQSCGCNRINMLKNSKFMKYIKLNRLRKGFRITDSPTIMISRIRYNTVGVINHLITEIDGHTCVLCGGTFETMDVHHIFPISTKLDLSCLDGFYHIYNISNLVTLCCDCHIINAHNGSGSKLNNNIQKQLIEYASTRSIPLNLIQKYKVLVSTIIEPWINDFIAKRNTILL